MFSSLIVDNLGKTEVFKREKIQGQRNGPGSSLSCMS